MTSPVSPRPVPEAEPAQPRWLDAEEQKAWRAWLYSTTLLQDRLERDLTHSAGVSSAYYEILVQLSEAPERRMRMSQLADRCLASRSRLSHAVSRLEERGWVAREVCVEDGRGQLAVLTDQGMAALVEAAPVHVASVREHLFDQLSPAQIAAMRDIGETLLRHLDAR
ncbi:MarR family transcriptional regulator [Modestobacter sp. VKM Ac-2986]|uniref:MarR family winged helix-turn-helix transcriptional regulator n=1 Tax=Modestobacter sp. VKM Ac-2986 TaxID=3004140 RepID=UPI0022AB818D|nr:MarR family transcriptional regulator [Modestobacter sp. VKM Ac-2986]MCZ2830498.1 MarR family transcriptional regulator [Modestobacter sp. VKM Ac-2986]